MSSGVLDPAHPPSFLPAPVKRRNESGVTFWEAQGLLHRMDGAAVEGLLVPRFWLNGVQMPSSESHRFASSHDIPPLMAIALLRLGERERREYVQLWQTGVPYSYIMSAIE